VFVGAVAGALVVGVVLVQVDVADVGNGRRPAGGLGHHPLAGLVPPHQVHRIGDLGGGVLRVGVVDVEPGAVGQDDVGQPQIVVGQRFGRIVSTAGVGEPPCVAQRRLLFVVPPGPSAGQL